MATVEGSPVTTINVTIAITLTTIDGEAIATIRVLFIGQGIEELGAGKSMDRTSYATSYGVSRHPPTQLRVRHCRYSISSLSDPLHLFGSFPANPCQSLSLISFSLKSCD